MKRKLLTPTYLSAFCLEISLFLRAGISISDGLHMLRDDDNDKSSKELMDLLYTITEEGKPLSAALTEAGGFPSYLLDMVILAEKTGKLEATMRSLSEYYDRQNRLSLSIKNAIFYPFILIIIMMIVIAVLVTQVLPIFNDVFNQVGAQMSSFATRIMSIGQAMSGASTAISITCAVLLLIVLLVFCVPSLKAGISAFFKNTFGGSGIFKRISSARFAFAMAMATSSGIDSDQAITLAAKVCNGGKVFISKAQECRKLLDEGTKLGDALSSSGIFTSRNSRMLSLAEQTGTLPDVMETIAQRSEETIRDEIDSLISKIEPTLVIVTSVIVGIILLSVMLPLVSIMSTIR